MRTDIAIVVFGVAILSIALGVGMVNPPLEPMTSENTTVSETDTTITVTVDGQDYVYNKAITLKYVERPQDYVWDCMEESDAAVNDWDVVWSFCMNEAMERSR